MPIRARHTGPWCRYGILRSIMASKTTTAGETGAIIGVVVATLVAGAVAAFLYWRFQKKRNAARSMMQKNWSYATTNGNSGSAAPKQKITLIETKSPVQDALRSPGSNAAEVAAGQKRPSMTGGSGQGKPKAGPEVTRNPAARSSLTADAAAVGPQGEGVEAGV